MIPLLEAKIRNSKLAKNSVMSDQKNAKQKALQLTLDKLDKTYGKGSVMKLGDEAIEEVESIPSGSIGLDIALGVGGYPRGPVSYTHLRAHET